MAAKGSELLDDLLYELFLDFVCLSLDKKTLEAAALHGADSDVKELGVPFGVGEAVAAELGNHVHHRHLLGSRKQANGVVAPRLGFRETFARKDVLVHCNKVDGVNGVRVREARRGNALALLEVKQVVAENLPAHQKIAVLGHSPVQEVVGQAHSPRLAAALRLQVELDQRLVVLAKDEVALGSEQEAPEGQVLLAQFEGLETVAHVPHHQLVLAPRHNFEVVLSQAKTAESRELAVQVERAKVQVRLQVPNLDLVAFVQTINYH